VLLTKRKYYRNIRAIAFHVRAEARETMREDE
jgi:hypothetical protein